MKTGNLSMLMRIAMAVSVLGCLTSSVWAQKQELGFTLGGVLSSSRSSDEAKLDLGTGTALQVNYGYRLFEASKIAIYGETHFLASPQRQIKTPDRDATRDYASLYVTPGVRIKFFPKSLISPYGVVGGGYALYEQSKTNISGGPNRASRTVSHGAFDFGAGVDVRVWKFIGLRGEVRDFFTGSPDFNEPAIKGGQHNVVAGGGFVLRFH